MFERAKNWSRIVTSKDAAEAGKTFGREAIREAATIVGEVAQGTAKKVVHGIAFAILLWVAGIALAGGAIIALAIVYLPGLIEGLSKLL